MLDSLEMSMASLLYGVVYTAGSDHETAVLRKYAGSGVPDSLSSG